LSTLQITKFVMDYIILFYIL